MPHDDGDHTGCSDAELAERILDAETAELALMLRRESSRRLVARIAALSADDPFYNAKAQHLLQTKAEIDKAIVHLEGVLSARHG